LKRNGLKNTIPEKSVSSASHISHAQVANPAARFAEGRKQMKMGQLKMKGLLGREIIRLENYHHIDIKRLMDGGY